MKGQLHRAEVRAVVGSGADESERKWHRKIRAEFKRMVKRAVRRLGRLIVRGI